MSRLTISQIMQAMASSVNQEATEPTQGGSEWSLWLEFINRATREWASAHDWEELVKIFPPSVTSATQATVALPQDFEKLSEDVVLYDGNTTSGTAFPEVPINTTGLYNETDKYVSVMGNQSDGMNLIFHPATLSSGASILIRYYSAVTSLASPSQIPMVPDPEFVIDRATAFIFEGRSDTRFQQHEAKARERLLLMVENSELEKFSSYSNPQNVITTLRKRGFRMGRD